ncbi:SubName: Full=Uncharacterized protein {ECO:0000313/EMBL:CCA70628.1} [Serendipita indica DSM 11827]|nr:SubName: Full=Uncharacterized protein {ECO:0000313/EMBL:CCA70628.1} [Serendipita indica DSM 11827]
MSQKQPFHGVHNAPVDPLTMYSQQLHDYTRQQWLEARRQAERESASKSHQQMNEKKRRHRRSPSGQQTNGH